MWYLAFFFFFFFFFFNSLIIGVDDDIKEPNSKWLPAQVMAFEQLYLKAETS